MTFNELRLAELSAGYDLDGGGYAFENASDPTLAALGAVVWDDPDFDYLTGDHPAPEFRGSSLTFAFAPNTNFEAAYGQEPKAWPKEIESAWEDTKTILVATGHFNETDRDCAWCGAGTELNHHPSDDDCDCKRCGGTHYVVSEGGSWAVYATIESEASR